MMGKTNLETEPDVMEMMREYERAHPGIVEAMQLLGLSMEQYEASLAALYTPTIVTSNSTEALNAHLERPARRGRGTPS